MNQVFYIAVGYTKLFPSKLYETNAIPFAILLLEPKKIYVFLLISAKNSMNYSHLNLFGLPAALKHENFMLSINFC